MIEIGNGGLSVEIAPERGAEIRSLRIPGRPNALAWPYDGLAGLSSAARLDPYASASSWLTITLLESPPTRPVSSVSRSGRIETTRQAGGSST
ncbi:hypothetical protein [Streptomyces sp. NPDC058045]|uniref:hypothetical protein n=1 Tax=Streptomyces sp. NPDC058045 TaxID=3346311 RepID=UPI0036E4091A